MLLETLQLVVHQAWVGLWYLSRFELSEQAMSSILTRSLCESLGSALRSDGPIDTIYHLRPSEMYFADMIEVLIKKRRLQPSEPSEWALMLGDLSMVLPLDRTVESLMGSVDLAMVTKSWAETHGFATGGRNGERRGGDPSSKQFSFRWAVPVKLTLVAVLASIFKRGSEQSKPRYGSRMDFESTYRKYKVQRKMPIGKHDRILAIDGDYIHVST